MEIGEEQAGPLASLMAAEGFSGIRARRDLNGVERYIGGAGMARPPVRLAAAAGGLLMATRLVIEGGVPPRG